jgi:hypothetical protein
LRAAKAAQVAGKEPLPGERRGNVNGSSRLTEAYWERQNALNADVAKARKRLNRAARGALTQPGPLGRRGGRIVVQDFVRRVRSALPGSRQ